MLRPLALLLVCGPTLAGADAKQSSTHTMQWVSGETIHIANQGGAINRHDAGRIAVEVFSNGKAIVTDTGKRHLHNLYDKYSTDDDTTWTNVWRGTWSITAAKLRLELDLHDRKCVRTKKSSDAAAETKVCDPVDKKLALDCKLEQLSLAQANGRKTNAVAWACSPAGSPKLADTPGYWMLGKGSCVQQSGGRGDGDRYEPCRP